MGVDIGGNKVTRYKNITDYHAYNIKDRDLRQFKAYCKQKKEQNKC